jgi:high-affinity iron transporter
MLAALVIVFREVFEAGLVVGIVMAVTAGVAGRGYWITGGVLAGVLGACVVALFTGGLSELFGGSGQEVFNASILGFAVLMLTWHNVWMARHGRELVAELRAAGEAVVAGSKSLLALAIVVAIAVLREGSEVVLFLYGVAAAQGGASWAMVAGGVAGLVLGASVCLLTYLGLITIPTRYLFGVTSALIALLAAGMAAQAITFLEQANIVTALDQTVWDTSWILSDSSFLGRALHTLIGYVDQPTAMQVVVYAMTLFIILMLMRLFSSPPARASANRLTPLSRARYRRRNDPGKEPQSTPRRGRRVRLPDIRRQDE